MTDKEKFIKLLYNAYVLKNYIVIYDNRPSIVYRDNDTGIVYVGIGKSMFNDLNTENLCEFYWNKDYVRCRDKDNGYHKFRFVKYAKIDDILA